MTPRVEKERQTERSQIRGCCYAAERLAFVFGAMHIIALSPVSSSELLIGVPSAFDTNIYTTHKHMLTHTHRGTQKHTRLLPIPPSHVHEEKLPSVRFVTASTKTSLSEGRRGDGREEGRGEGREQEKERGCFICLK